MEPISWLFPLVVVVAISLIYLRSRSRSKATPASQIRERSSSPPPLPQPNIPEKDHWEVQENEVAYKFPVKATLRIRYVDGAGLATERTVDVRECGPYLDDTMIVAHCRLRDARRTFLASRIKSCFDEETGEVVNGVGQYLRARYEGSPECSLEQFVEAEYDALRVLLYVAKADGFLRAPEKTLIAAYCRETCGDQRVSDIMMADVLTGLEVPSIHVFRRIVGTLKSKPTESRAKIVETVEKLIATDKKAHPAEQEALDYLRERWK